MHVTGFTVTSVLIWLKTQTIAEFVGSGAVKEDVQKKLRKKSLQIKWLTSSGIQRNVYWTMMLHLDWYTCNKWTVWSLDGAFCLFVCLLLCRDKQTLSLEQRRATGYYNWIRRKSETAPCCSSHILNACLKTHTLERKFIGTLYSDRVTAPRL